MTNESGEKLANQTSQTVYFCLGFGFWGWELALFASVLAHSLLNLGQDSSLASI